MENNRVSIVITNTFISVYSAFLKILGTLYEIYILIFPQICDIIRLYCANYNYKKQI